MFSFPVRGESVATCRVSVLYAFPSLLSDDSVPVAVPFDSRNSPNGLFYVRAFYPRVSVHVDRAPRGLADLLWGRISIRPVARPPPKRCLEACDNSAGNGTAESFASVLHESDVCVLSV